ncbi:MAG: rhodanese-like domain-containing protein [Paracoccaceae bacterium]
MFNLRPSQPAAGRIAAQDAVSRSISGDLVIIDVREAQEVAASGRAAGALHVPLTMLQRKCDPASADCVEGLTCDRPVAIYCASGGRSQMAAQMLRSMGYDEVYNIGGLGDWVAAGGTVTR